MAQPAKRVAMTSLNWAKLTERLTVEQQHELDRLKSQNSNFHSEVVQHKENPPKVDWAALKKQMPEQAATIESLQKQWESLKIPYGSVPEELNKEIEKWTQYNEARLQFHEQKTKDGLEEVKKIEEKWAKAPPVDQMYPHFHNIQFFSHEYGYGEKHGYADYRVYHDDGEFRYLNSVDALKGINADDESCWRRRFHDYQGYPRQGNPRIHWGVPHGQAKPPTYWPEPLTELGRKYVRELKAKKREQALAGGGDTASLTTDHH